VVLLGEQRKRRRARSGLRAGCRYRGSRRVAPFVRHRKAAVMAKVKSDPPAEAQTGPWPRRRRRPSGRATAGIGIARAACGRVTPSLRSAHHSSDKSVMNAIADSATEGRGRSPPSARAGSLDVDRQPRLGRTIAFARRAPRRLSVGAESAHAIAHCQRGPPALQLTEADLWIPRRCAREGARMSATVPLRYRGRREGPPPSCKNHGPRA
jgi:hypothetical protein